MPDSKTQEREKVVEEVTERVAERVEERLKEFLTQEALGARPVDRDVGYVRYRRGGYGYGIWPILNLNNVVQQSGYGGGMIQTPWDRGTGPWVEYDRRRRRGEYVAEMARMLRDLVREAVKEEYDELKKENEGSEREEGRGETGEGEGEAAPEPLSVAEYVGRILTTTAAASEVDLGNLIGQRVKIGDTVINIDPSDLDAIYVVNNENRTYSLGKVGNRKIRKIERDGDKIEITFEDGKQIELSEQTIYDQTGPGLRVKVSRGAWAGTYSIKHIHDEENNEVYLVENKGVLPKGELHIKVRGEGWTVEELAEFLESLGIGEGSERDLRYSVTHEKRDWKRLFLGKKRTIMDASYRTDNLALMIAQKYGLLRTRSGRAIGEGDNGIDRWVDEVVRGETSLEDARKALERELKKVYSTEITAPNEITLEYDGGKVVVEIEAGYASSTSSTGRVVAPGPTGQGGGPARPEGGSGAGPATPQTPKKKSDPEQEPDPGGGPTSTIQPNPETGNPRRRVRESQKIGEDWFDKYVSEKFRAVNISYDNAPVLGENQNPNRMKEILRMVVDNTDINPDLIIGVSALGISDRTATYKVIHISRDGKIRQKTIKQVDDGYQLMGEGEYKWKPRSGITFEDKLGGGNVSSYAFRTGNPDDYITTSLRILKSARKPVEEEFVDRLLNQRGTFSEYVSAATSNSYLRNVSNIVNNETLQDYAKRYNSISSNDPEKNDKQKEIRRKAVNYIFEEYGIKNKGLASKIFTALTYVHKKYQTNSPS